MATIEVQERGVRAVDLAAARAGLVAFAEEMGEKGPQASTVKLLGKHRLRV